MHEVVKIALLLLLELETTLSDITCTLASVLAYPIKSCAGFELRRGLLVETGLDLDRAWMVVDHRGMLLTQRELPRMALVQTAFKGSDELVLRAPGMLALHLRVDTVEEATSAQVWDDHVKAYDMGSLAAQWFTDFLRPGLPAAARLRLVRFDPEQQRRCDPKWTGNHVAQTAFADAYPLLVTSTASLAELNQRLQAAGAPAVDMRRFRPNLVLDGLQAFDEDHIDTLDISTPQGTVQLKLVKPCVRCSIPNVDPASAETHPAVGDALAAFRSDARMQGAITFGMNAIVLQGIDHELAPGQAVQARLAFRD